MKIVLGTLAAVAVLVVAAALTAALLGGFDPAEAQEDTGADESTAQGVAEPDDVGPLPGLVPGFAGDFVEDVLSDLVEDGTITAEQADEIAAAFEARIDAMIEDLPRLETLFGEDSPLPEILEDGELSEEEQSELEELLGQFAPFGPRGFRFFQEHGELPPGLREHLDTLPFREFLEDGELSEEERAQLEEMYGDRGHFWFFSEDDQPPFGPQPLGPRGFRFFGDEGQIPEELQEFFDDFEFDDLPFGAFFEDGELSDEERARLREFFDQFRGRGFGGLFEGLDPSQNVDEAAFSA